MDPTVEHVPRSRCDIVPPKAHDELWMQRALEQAHAAAVDDEVPVGAVVVLDGMLIAEAGNRTRTSTLR